MLIKLQEIAAMVLNLEPSLQAQSIALVCSILLLMALLAFRSLYRHIAVEILRPSLTGIVIFVVLFVSNSLLFNLMEFLLNQKVPAPVVAKVLVYQLPAITLLAVPVSFLLGIVLGLGRMGQDFELMAMRIGGLSFFKVCLPVYALALVVSLLVLILGQTVVPVGNRKGQDLLRQYLVQAFVQNIESEKIISAPDSRVFVLGKNGENLLLFDGKNASYYPLVYTSETVRWSGSGRWQLSGSQVLKFDKAGRIAAEAKVSSLMISLDPESQNMGNPILSAEEKTIAELRADLATVGGEDTQMGRESLANIHSKLTLPFATLCLALIATPLTIASARVRYGAFLFSVLAAGLYYIGMGLFPAYAKTGLLLPKLTNLGLPLRLLDKLAPHQVPLVVWFPTIFFLFIGTLLTWRVSRR